MRLLTISLYTVTTLLSLMALPPPLEGRVGESEKYLLNRHKENHFTVGEIVRDFIIGVSDGLTVPFALAAGLSGANASSSIILNAGIAEVAAGAISMGLSGSLTLSNLRLDPMEEGMFRLKIRDCMSPSNLIGNYPHMVVMGSGRAFGFLVDGRMILAHLCDEPKGLKTSMCMLDELKQNINETNGETMVAEYQDKVENDGGAER
ncbi:hypothetical protein L2E82_49535 [Cichorium intybus]|uniref:Uncharacterized protein n=1 Tax=Cichorium intybus TaxID=13427 RepID=A0ACB8Z112_CICIN|nr:hypothetical protein L2E82_49535 [Cichorium intybus]